MGGMNCFFTFYILTKKVDVVSYIVTQFNILNKLINNTIVLVKDRNILCS
eukprot:UN23371